MNGGAAGVNIISSILEIHVVSGRVRARGFFGRDSTHNIAHAVPEQHPVVSSCRGTHRKDIVEYFHTVPHDQRRPDLWD